MGKLFYSIGDICFVLEESPWHVRDALTAAGVPMIHGGKAADLSHWWSGVIEEPNGNVLIIDGNHCTNPGPDDVVVSSDLLPESWRRRLEGVDEDSVGAPVETETRQSPPLVPSDSQSQPSKRWTGEFLEEVRAYREQHGTLSTAQKYGVSESLIRRKLPRDKPKQLGYSAFTHRPK